MNNRLKARHIFSRKRREREREISDLQISAIRANSQICATDLEDIFIITN